MNTLAFLLLAATLPGLALQATAYAPGPVPADQEPYPADEAPYPADPAEPYPDDEVAEAGQACAIMPGNTPLQVVGDRMQTFDYAGNLAISEDGGRHWTINAGGGCNGGPTNFWRLPPTSKRICASFNSGFMDYSEEHRCTNDEGKTWRVLIVSEGRERTSSVLADPTDDQHLYAVRTDAGALPAASLVRSTDGGDTWAKVLPSCGSLAIPGAVGRDHFLVLQGATGGGYTHLLLRSFRNNDAARVEGPWSDKADTRITQTVVNSHDSNHWIISIWFSREHREITYLTGDRGQTYTELSVPDNAIWPVDFLNARRKLLVELRAPRSDALPRQAAIFSPKAGTWTTFALPDMSYSLVARGGHVYATHAFSLSRLDKLTPEGPEWHEIYIGPPDGDSVDAAPAADPWAGAASSAEGSTR